MPGVVYVPGSPDFLVLYVDFSSEDVKVEKKPFVTREQLEEIKDHYRAILRSLERPAVSLDSICYMKVVNRL